MDDGLKKEPRVLFQEEEEEKPRAVRRRRKWKNPGYISVSVRTREYLCGCGFRSKETDFRYAQGPRRRICLKCGGPVKRVDNRVR